MTLNHINLVVTDLAKATELFETYFDFKRTDAKGNVITVLKNDQDFTLVLMTDKKEETVYPGSFHIGFMQNEATQVTELYEKLKQGGIALGREPQKIRDSFGFYFTFDCLLIEVGHYTD